jgi:hypothetical protein
VNTPSLSAASAVKLFLVLAEGIHRLRRFSQIFIDRGFAARHLRKSAQSVDNGRRPLRSST